MKKNLWNMSISSGVLGPSFVTLCLFLIFACLSFFWLMDRKTPAEVAVAVSALALMVIISLAVTFFARKAVLTRVREAAAAIKDISAGNMTRRMEAASDDPFGEVAKNFNALMDTLRETLAKVSEGSKKISFASNTLETTAVLMTKGVEAIVTEVSSVASASEEMASTSTEIARNCAVAAESSDIVNRSAHTGENIIQGIVSAMARIDERVKESALIIKGLGERSDQIGAIAGIINDIADQTNLLALNAAIEAARAGEHGRGFAVVADEVRKLAERTTGATKDIGSTIQAMQSETKSAVKSMEEGVLEVETGTEETEKSGNALKEILHQVNTLASQINQIAVASEQQTSTTNEITGNIQKISEVMSHASGNIRENGEASSQIAALTIGLNTLMQKYTFQDKSLTKASASPEEAIALVKKAADYLRSHGKDKAFGEFNNPRGMFAKGDLYIFVQDLKGFMRAHPQNPILIGKNVSAMKDVDGKLFGKELVDIAKAKGSGWIDYNWLNPSTGEVVPKSTYCMRVDDHVVSCGIYR